ncbi:cyclin-like protein [Chytriomyces sp. MP71]|nr:cyclin-like protein [Chytriomyces sp. MP71]
MINALGRAMKLRQQILATATVFFKRYYLKHSLFSSNSIDPTLMLATCVYLACKVEESPVHIKSVSQAMTSQQMLGPQCQIDPSKISECEFYLMEGLEFYMIVFHPYQPVIVLIRDLNLMKEHKTIICQNAWMVVNDAYKSDLPLIYPPHMMALVHDISLHVGVTVLIVAFNLLGCHLPDSGNA